MAAQRPGLGDRLRRALGRSGETEQPQKSAATSAPATKGGVVTKAPATRAATATKATTAKKVTTPKQAAPKKVTTAKQAAPKKVMTAKQAAPKKAAVKKAAATAKQAPATKAAAVAKAAPAKSAAVKKAPVTKKAAPNKAAAKKAPTAKAAPSTKAAPARRTPKPAATPTTTAAPLTGDEAWTAVELATVRGELEAQAQDLRHEIGDAESTNEQIQRDASNEGSGDEADAGTKTFEREHEMSLANNSRDLLQQVERALARLDAGTYGACEHCGNAIPKARLQAFPRVTLCVSCKQREERR